jgi:hypothetical protein
MVGHGRTPVQWKLGDMAHVAFCPRRRGRRTKFVLRINGPIWPSPFDFPKSFRFSATLFHRCAIEVRFSFVSLSIARNTCERACHVFLSA